MKKLLIALMGVASISLIIDVIYLLSGATYTLVGLITALINLLIVGVGLDVVRS